MILESRDKRENFSVACSQGRHNRWFSNKTEVIFVVVPDKEFRESEKHFITLSKGVLFNRIDHEYIYRDTDLAIHGRFLDFKPL